MKNALELRFASISAPEQAERYVVRVRFAECLQRQSALRNGDGEAVHAFRLACKHLRFALERLQPQQPALARAQGLLSTLTDELGWAHDCVRLAELAAECNAPLVAARARRDRDRYVVRARRLWRRGFLAAGEFEPLAAYAGFTWSTS